ncbi:hypothetical protein V496_00136 [Pseudogymnoascus sp. VKM F-4515 (FW-2607)]|nr:hypothetical protein V496_00136 [Pseudogymnoascus sp. VKM F-4515 (FW-2607)]
MVIGLGVLGAISACSSLAQDIVGIITTIAKFNSDFNDIAIRFEDEASLLGDLARAFEVENFELSLSEDDNEHLCRVFEHISQRLHNVDTKLQKIRRQNFQGKINWVFCRKALEQAESDLHHWTQRLGTRFIMLSSESKARILNDLVIEQSRGSATELTENLNRQVEMQRIAHLSASSLDVDVVDLSNRVTLPSEPGQLRFSARLDMSINLIIDLLRNPDSRIAYSPSWVKEEVGKLVFVLREAKPQVMHIPPLKGFVQTGIRLQPWGLAYSLPPAYSGTTPLLELLKKTNRQGQRLPALHPLEERFRLAHDIATAIEYVHSLGWVHKTIRSSNILVSWLDAHRKSPEGLGSAFLVGFEYARHKTANSTGSAYDGWTNELYRHPERQNMFSGELLVDSYYERYHDVYSFGVVLLELGRWKTLEATPEHFENKKPLEIKQNLLNLSGNISPFVGSRYTRIVRKCLDATADSPSMTEILGDLEDLKV